MVFVVCSENPVLCLAVPLLCLLLCFPSIRVFVCSLLSPLPPLTFFCSAMSCCFRAESVHVPRGGRKLPCWSCQLDSHSSAWAGIPSPRCSIGIFVGHG